MGKRYTKTSIDRYTDRAVKLASTSRGSSMVEMMVAVSLLLFMMGGVWMTSSFMNTIAKRNEIRLELANEARLAMDRIVLGYKPLNDPNLLRDGLRASTNFQIMGGGDELRFVDSNGTERRIRENGTDIEYFDPADGSWEILYRPPTGEENITLTDLDFQLSPTLNDVVEVKLNISRRILGEWHHGSIATEVHRRN